MKQDESNLRRSSLARHTVISTDVNMIGSTFPAITGWGFIKLDRPYFLLPLLLPMFTNQSTWPEIIKTHFSAFNVSSVIVTWSSGTISAFTYNS